MGFTKIFISIFILSILLQEVCFSATEEEFPKIGSVKNDGANVRAGDNINFESLCKLGKRDSVKIIGKCYNWFKIILPKKAHLYIKNDYVDLTSEKGMGVVNALHVNLRAGPGTKYSILGQVSKPEELNVITELDGWYKVEPPDETIGWIHSSQISFKLEEIKHVEEEPQPDLVEVPPRTNLRLELEPPEPQGNLTFSTQDNQ